MKPEDIGPILAIAERRERQEWRRKQREALLKDQDSMMPSPRSMRARQFAYQVFGMIEKFVPEACRDDVIEELMINAYGNDIEITQVTSERDVERAAALKAAEVALMPKFIIND